MGTHMSKKKKKKQRQHQKAVMTNSGKDAEKRIAQTLLV